MADIAKKPTTEAPQHKIRLTLTSTNVKVLEKGVYSKMVLLLLVILERILNNPEPSTNPTLRSFIPQSSYPPKQSHRTSWPRPRSATSSHMVPFVCPLKHLE